MFQYIFIMLWRQKSRSLLAMGSFLLAACTLVLLSATTLSTVVQAKQIISGNWRSSYDLVVLPSGTTIAAGKTLPIDSFQGFDGGISIQQYEQIKNLSGVEVAAPVAFVGSVQYPFSKVSFGSTPLSPGFYQVQWAETTSNGRQSLTLQQDTDRVYVDSHPCLSNTPGSSPPALQKLGPYNSNFVGCIDVPGLQAWFPNLGTYLLAAIDPDAENQLFHVNKNIVSGRMLSEQDTAQLDKHDSYGYDASGATYPIYDISLLINANSSNLEQVRLDATVTQR